MFLGSPLVEATGSLANFEIIAETLDSGLLGAYESSAFNLVQRLFDYTHPRCEKPALLVLHASSRRTSNTMALWDMAAAHLDGQCEITEIGLRNGAIYDCAGCSYTTCLHFGEQGGCFYGGVVVEDVFPAIVKCDALVMLCPNYNDAPSANIMAFINRLTALFRQASFSQKLLFAIVVSGYSGGDIIASQLVSALNMNKGFVLPARFAWLETANRQGSAARLPKIDERAENFAHNLLTQLLNMNQ
jgi:multimeric flavodoxin WrbA